MPARFPLYPAHTAVLSMDCQSGIVSIYVKDEKDAFLGRIATVLSHARAAGMTVIHVQVGFRPGLPEVSSRNVLSARSSPHPNIRNCSNRPLERFPPRSLPKTGKSSLPNIVSALSPERTCP